MTRFLADALQVSEPSLRAGLGKLERANGHPNTDIRFSVDVNAATRGKIQELGLDPRDTTPAELYEALQSRVAADDKRLVRNLRMAAGVHVSAEANLTDGLVHALHQLPGSKQSYALKNSVLKALLKQQPPKKALKQLGYRSIDSFLKHESPLSAMAAAWLCEADSWQKQFTARYKKLTAKDFETRALQIIQPHGKRWQALSQSVVSRRRHNLLPFRELATLVVLPFPETVPSGAATVSLTLALHELNEIRAGSTFLKLSQVRPDFGSLVIEVAHGQPSVGSEHLDAAVPWHIIQRYYARLTDQASSLVGTVFEPHIELADMAWQSVERMLSSIDPTLAFWHDSAHLGMIHQHRPVSMNLLDAALNYCNKLPFEKRVAHYFQHSLRHELLLSYLQPETVEHTVLAQLQPQSLMVREPTLA